MNKWEKLELSFLLLFLMAEAIFFMMAALFTTSTLLVMVFAIWCVVLVYEIISY